MGAPLIPLILASASPRRRALLEQCHVAFEVDASNVPEVPRPGEDPEPFALRAAREKTTAVAARHPDAYILGADTIVVIDRLVLGKPIDRDDARRMLQLLSGRTHRVLTAVVLMEPAGGVAPRQWHEALVESHVAFRRLEAAAIEAYVASAEPYDKAGGYAVQGAAQAFIAEVRGSRSNVIGLPVEEVLDLLRQRCPGTVAVPSVGA